MYTYSGRRLIEPAQDQPFLALISGLTDYPAGLFSKKSKLAFKSGPNKLRALLTDAVLSEVYCIMIDTYSRQSREDAI